jgi:molecular chaperone GrpE
MPEPDVKKNTRKAGQKKESEAVEQSSDRKTGSGDSGDGGSRIEELQTQLQQLGEKTDELNDQLLRKSAEFENFRKRLFRDKEESIKYANAALLNDVLPIIDDFERAIQSASDSKDFDAFHTGVSMIEARLVSILERNWGLRRFSADGELFDPEKHEAIAVEETRDHDQPVVLEDYQKGYLLHDRVLRPAKVKVAKPISQEAVENNDSNEQ